MWLDELPVDVGERIFRNLLIEWDPSSSIYANVVALSRASDKQKEAALLALPTHKTFNLTIDGTNESFNELLAPKLQSLSLWRQVLPSDEPLFRAPNLCTVGINADLDALNVIAGCASLRNLSLFVDDDTSWDQILECLRTLRLNQLLLQYPKQYYTTCDNCPCVPFEGSSSGSNARIEALLSALPGLRSLVIQCEAHKQDYGEQITQRLLQLPNITNVNIISSVPSTHEQRLRKLHNVIIDDSTFDQFENALKLGPVVTHFFAKQTVLSNQQLSQLKKCKRLKAISIALQPGAEADLADLVRVLTNLQSMEVFWPVRMTEDEEGVRMRPYYVAFPGAIQRAVAEGKKLTELQICNATLDAFELEEILQSLGKRLRTFTLTISYSDLEGLSCLQRCLDCILKYNSLLSKLGVQWQGYAQMDPYRAKAIHKGRIQNLLRSTRLLYARNKIISLPYFLVALRGYYHLAFEYLGALASSDSESGSLEEEGAGLVEIAMEE